MGKFSEHKATLISAGISLAAFLIFLLMLVYYEKLQSDKLIEAETLIIQASFGEEKILLYGKSIQVPELPANNGVSLSAAFGEEFATQECLAEANNESIDLSIDSPESGSIMVFDDDWYREASQYDHFHQTLFAEGYFGVIRVSRPCYNAARDKAIIYYEQDCGPECGNGEVILLILEDGQWRRLDQKIVWVAPKY
ncbi:MAG: hypothetical protein JXA04_03640 [Gammaproteobacteria bacterium]|nr:hypothetical protein [Gammaproteobacteria bacterium]